MSITRLQQARQMYAMGQRVRFRGGGMDMGNESNQAQSASMGNSTSSNSSNDNSNDNSNSNNNDGPKGPSELGTSTRTVNKITAPPAYEIIGGEKFNVTPDTRDDRERARVKADIMKAPIPNFTPKGIEYFKNNELVNTFAPKKNQFNMFSLLVMQLYLQLTQYYLRNIEKQKVFIQEQNLQKILSNLIQQKI